MQSIKEFTYKLFAVLFLSVLLIGCSGNKSLNSSSAFEKKAFPSLPSAPKAITDQREIAKFVADHFWDKYLKDYLEYPSDSTMLLGVANEDVEMAMGTYATILENKTSLEDVQQAIKIFFDRIEAVEAENPSSEVFERLTDLTKKYFYDPNSPVRNEDIYLPFVKRLSESSLVDENMRPAYGFDAMMCSLNQQGTKAADFSFKDLKGKTHTLYTTKADVTLLFFSNPGCPACSEIIEALKISENISKAIESKKLAVVNIYIDLDIEDWKAYAVNYPSNWLSGYDYKYLIRTDTSYNVRAIPSLYILDKDKKVIMKDAPQEKVLTWLENNARNNL